MEIHPQSCSSRSQLLPWPHSSVTCSDADVLSTSLNSTNGSCPRAAVRPTRRCASPDCGAGTRKPTGTESAHTLTCLDTCTYTYAARRCTQAALRSDMTVFLNSTHLCFDSEHRAALARITRSHLVQGRSQTGNLLIGAGYLSTFNYISCEGCIKIHPDNTHSSSGSCRDANTTAT